jgi:hypothetical protein
MITVSHPQVNQYVRALLAALDEKGELYEFHPTLSVGRRRVGIPGVRQKVRQHPYREIVRLFAQRFGQEWLIRNGSGLASSDAVAWEFDHQVAKGLTSCSTIYCYEDSALETFRAAERIGARRFYAGMLSLVAEYGCPALATGEPVRNNARLRVLFVGTMTQRKGLADLFTAMKCLGRSDVELLVLGTPLLPLPFYRKEYPSFVYEATRPTRKVQELMLTCDVLVLPSIVEGRAMVQMEALSCGLPIVVTPNAGAEDLIEPGRTGFLIPIRAPEVLAERIDWIADHRDWVDDMRSAIMEKARQSDWRRYSEKVLSVFL